jgi:hypothetical protein
MSRVMMLIRQSLYDRGTDDAGRGIRALNGYVWHTKKMVRVTAIMDGSTKGIFLPRRFDFSYFSRCVWRSTYARNTRHASQAL